MEETNGTSNIYYVDNRLSNNNNSRSNSNGIRRNTRFPFNRESNTYRGNRQNGSCIGNDTSARYSQSRFTANRGASTFDQGHKYSQPQCMPSYFHAHNDASDVNYYGNQRRNYGTNSRGNYNHQDKSGYASNFQRKPNYHNEYRGKYNNKKKFEKRNVPDESKNLNQRESLIWQLSHNKYECMICVTIIRSEASTWSCDNCFHIFHVPCIEKWAKSGDNTVVRCPACQKEFNIESSETRQKFSVYRCFCGKLTNPVFKRGTIPHSCDEICGRSLVSRSNFTPLYGHVAWQDANIEVLDDSPGLGLELPVQDDELVEECNELAQDDNERDYNLAPMSQKNDSSDLQRMQSSFDIHSSTLESKRQSSECSESPIGNDVVTPETGRTSFVDKDSSPELALSIISGNPEELESTSLCENATTLQQAQSTPDVKMTLDPFEIDKTSNSPVTDWSCPHSCVLLCHPGPCPPCEALVTRACHCSRTRITTKCMADSRTLVCGSRCGRALNCRVHRCMKVCHAGPCDTCLVRKMERCWCDEQATREVACDAGQDQMKRDDSRYSCGANCGRTLSCGEHRCSSICHEGDCKSCSDVPKTQERCWCGRVTVASLRGGNERTSCIDSRPDCGGLCGRAMPRCGHTCASKCHPGPCPPCNVVVENVRCRCDLSVLPAMVCSVATDKPDSLMCSKPCRKRLACGRHQCRQRCCIAFDSDQHECVLPCGRVLSCQQHSCERQCGHAGRCPVCPNVSFEELSCHCGAEISLPPIACGQLPPACSRDCTRPQPCDHPVRHNCHPDSELPCPPCTELTSKQCPNQHRVYHHVPCFRPVATCGLPCGRSFFVCQHLGRKLCQRLCHSGTCQPDNSTDNSERCRQQTPCEFSVQLYCPCKARNVTISCEKLENTVALVKSNCSTDMKRDNLELVLDPDGSVSLVCGAECWKVSRYIGSTSSNGNTYYPEWIKKFAMSNMDFILTTEKLLLDLLKKSETTTNLVYSHTIRNLSYEEINFISCYSACFKMTSKSAMDKAKKRQIIIEVNQAKCSSPKPLLSELLNNEWPQLFSPKPEEEKNSRVHSSNSTMSFADRIRSSIKE